MSGRVSGLRALVTGAAQGIGLACAAKLVSEGAYVVVTDIQAGELEQAAEKIGAVAYHLDVRDEQQWTRIVADLQKDGPLDILVHSAGFEGRSDAPADPTGTTLQDWNDIFSANAAGAFLACKHGLPAMRSGGSMVIMSSVASMLPTPFLTAYGAAKASIDHLARTVALHAASRQIRVNTVHPGQVETPMLEKLFSRWGKTEGVSADVISDQFRQTIPFGRFQTPEDIAHLMLFLSSPESCNITGQSIACDGGFILNH